MPWWGWLISGIGLLALEMFVIDAQFYLVFIGAAAAVVGLMQLMGLDIPESGQWVVFAVLAILAMVAFRRRVYNMIRGRAGHVDPALPLGSRVLVPVDLEPGKTCRIEYRGTSWTARNVDAVPLLAGREAAISAVDGLTLNLKAISG